MIKWFLLREPLSWASALLNHRGSSMNLRFQLIHRVSTREFLKKNREEKIQKACHDSHKERRMSQLEIVFIGIIITKKIFRIFLTSLRIFGWNRVKRLSSKKLKTIYSISVETSICVFCLEPYEMKFSYTALGGGIFIGLPISIKYMIGSRNVSRFKRLQMI